MPTPNTPYIQLWDKYRLTNYRHSQKGQKWKIKKNHWSNAVLKFSQANCSLSSLIRFQVGNNPSQLSAVLLSSHLCSGVSWWCSFCFGFYPVGHISFFMKDSMCRYLSNFVKLLPSSRNWVSNSFLSFCILSVPLKFSHEPLYFTFIFCIYIFWGTLFCSFCDIFV